MKLDELLEIHKELCERARKKLEQRSQVFADENDVLGNYRKAEKEDLTPQQGIILRIYDEISKASNISEMKGEIDDFESALENIINYAVALQAVEEEERGINCEE